MDSEPHSALFEQLAGHVPEAILAAGLAAYEIARGDGLCHDGAWECAINAMYPVEIEKLLDEITREHQHA